MTISELITALQKRLEQDGDIPVVWNSEGRLYEIDADEFHTKDNIDAETIWTGAEFSRALIIGDD